MNYIFLGKGKARKVFRELVIACAIESMFGRLVEPLEPCDFSSN